MKNSLLTLLFCGAFGAVSASEPPPEMPLAVASFGAASLSDGSLFVYGGHSGKPHNYNREEVHGDFFQWKPGDAEWKALQSGEPAQGASLVVSERGLIRVGGIAARNAKSDESDMWSSETADLYDMEKDEWLPLPKMPHRRSSHDSIVAGNTLYVIGGWAMEGEEKTTWHDTYLSLDLSNSEAKWETHPQPFKRRALAVQAVGSLVYVIGGMTHDNNTTGEVEILNTETGEWTEGPALPPGRLDGFGFAAVVQDGRLLASGLRGHLLEMKSDGWVKVAELEHPRYFHRLLSGGPGAIVAVGGASKKGGRLPTEVVQLPKKTAAVGSDWPRYQGPRGDGSTPDSAWQKTWPAEGPPVAWKKELGIGMASFAIVGDRVYTSGNNGEDQDMVWCLDLETGEPVWQHDYAVATQAHKMSIVPFGPATTPTVVGDQVFVTSREGHLLCLDATDGAVIWESHLIDQLGGKRPVYGYSSSPAWHEGKLFVDVGGREGSTACLNANTGEVIWQAGEGEAGYATPWVTELDGKDVIVLFKGEALELRAAADGALLARHATETRDYCNCATPVRAGDLFFISHTGNMGSRVLEWKDGDLKELWTDKDVGLLFQSGVPFDGKLLAFNDQKRGEDDLRLMDLETGNSVWESSEIGKGTSILTDDGHGLFFSGKGELVSAKVSLEGVEVLSRVQVMGGKSYVQPALAHGRVICRNNEGTAVCLDLR